MDGLADAFALLREPLAALGGEAWIVGGGVRDALLGRPVTDVDVAYDGDVSAAAAAIATHARAGRFALSERFGGWRVHGRRLGVTVDIIPLGGTLPTDLARRDFTVNTLAAPVAGGDIVDLHGGRADLAEGVLRLVSAEAFRDDPVRLMRLPRQAHELGFSIEPATAERCRADAALIHCPAPERIFDEFRRLLALDSPEVGIALLADLGLLAELAPIQLIERAVAAAREAATRVDDAMGRELADGLSRGAMAIWGAALASDTSIGGAGARAWCERMKTSTRLRDGLVRIVDTGISLDHEWTPDECYDLLLTRSPVEAEAVLVALAVAGPSESRVRRAEQIVGAVRGQQLRLAAGTLVTGDFLAAHLGLQPGPWLGELIAGMNREQATGRLATRAEAILFAEIWQSK